MIRIERVVSNVKAGCDVKLGDKTLIVGVNGCHRLGQPILMFDGTVQPVENVKLGQNLMGPDSTPRTVTRLQRGEGRMFEVVPVKGTPFVVNADHVLTLVCCATTSGSNVAGAIVDVKVSDWLTWPTHKQNLWKLFRVGVEFSPSPNELPLDSYLMGILLGDGGLQGSPCVHKADPEIAAFLREHCAQYEIDPKPILHDGVLSGWRLSGDYTRGDANPITTVLRELGLWETTSHTKFVPEIYKRSSLWERLQILAGLMDTDGTCGLRRRGFDYISASRLLAEGVVFLARSVGLGAYLAPCEKHDQNGNGGIYFRVSVSGRTHIIPTKIERKKAQPRVELPTSGRRGGLKDALRVGFTIVDLQVTEPFYGFSLSGDGRFLLGDFTVTHNSGKSSIVNALELATRGTASDIVGRAEVAREADLLTLAPAGHDLFAEVYFSDGSLARRTICREKPKGKGSQKKSHHVYLSAGVTEPLGLDAQSIFHPETVLPLWPLREAIAGSVDTVRKFFLQHSVGALTVADVLQRLDSKELEGKFTELTASLPPSTPAIDQLLTVLQGAKDRARTLSKSADASKSVANAAGQGLGAPPTEAEYAEAKGALEQAKAGVEAAVAHYQRALQIQSAQERLVVARGAVAQLETAVAQRQAAVDEVVNHFATLPKLDVVPEGQIITLQALKWHAKEKREKCGLCESVHPVDHFVQRDTKGDAYLAEHNTLRARHEKGNAILSGRRESLKQVQDQLVMARMQLEVNENHLKSLGDISLGQTPPTIEEARIVQTAAESRLKTYDDSRTRWAASSQQRSGALRQEKDALEWAQLAEACTKCVSQLLDGACAAFSSRIQAYLPLSDNFSLRLRDGEREVCQFGLMRGGVLHSSVSGAEWARLCVALATVCGPKDGKLSVVIPEDRMWDPETLHSVMVAFRAIPQQVVLTSTILPQFKKKESVPAGWTLIEVKRKDEPEEKALKAVEQAIVAKEPVAVKPKLPNTIQGIEF